MSTLTQVTVMSSTDSFVELATNGGNITCENLGPESVYLYNGYGEDVTFSATAWYVLYAGQSIDVVGNTENINLLAVTTGGTSRVNVITTP